MISVALLTLSAFSPTAEARPSRHHHRPATHHARPGPRVSPRVVIRVGPWSVRYRPAPRLGYVWVAGSVMRGVNVAGYWRPTTAPPTEDHLWVDGYWEGDEWVDGYWRIDEIDGMIWIDGEYDDVGEFDEGYWLEESTGAPVQSEYLPEDAALAVPVGGEYDTEEPVYLEDEGEEVHHAPPEW